MKLQSFRAVCEELAQLHELKAQDYGRDGDPLANLRASEIFGIPTWLGTILRANDKVHRMAAFARKGVLANEPLEDSLKDLAVYAIHALRLYRELQTKDES